MRFEMDVEEYTTRTRSFYCCKLKDVHLSFKTNPTMLYLTEQS